MESRSRPRRIVRFDDFEANLDSAELFKNGLKVRLPEQPFQLLTILLECPGEVVSRDDLRRRLWPENTHVDFDRSLNTAASKLRDALGDVAEKSRYIETLPKRGYRFIAPLNGTGPANSSLALEETPASTLSPFRRLFLPVSALVIAASMIGWAYSRWQAAPPLPGVVRSVRLTNDDFSKNSELASDGPRIYFSAWRGGRGVLAQVSAAGGDTELLPTPSIGPETSACVRGISPDKQHLLVVTGKQRTTLAGYALWTVSPTTLASRRTGDLVANDVGWSPDSRRIAYATFNQIWIADADGARAHKIAEQGGLTGYPRWSPDGQRIRFSSLAWDTYQQSIWEVSAQGGPVRPLFPGWSAEQWGGQWSPDGSFFVFNSDSNIWGVSERATWLRKTPKPAQLTFGPLSFLAPLPAADNRRLYAVGEIRRGELLRYDGTRAEFVRFLPGLSADDLDFSRNGEWMTYVSYPQQELWRSRTDGTRRQQLTSAPMKVGMPRWSPDNSQIVFNGKMPGEVWRGYLIGSGGGIPKVIVEGPNPDPFWSPDGTRAIVAGVSHAGSGLLYWDPRTGTLSPVPDAIGMGSAKWSPDGRYICAERVTDFACMLFDVGKQKWSEIAPTSCWWQSWTSDSKGFFCLEGKGEAIRRFDVGIRRFDVGTRRFERLVSLRDYRITGNHLSWLGISPDGSPLILRDAGSQEIYALEGQPR